MLTYLPTYLVWTNGFLWRECASLGEAHSWVAWLRDVLGAEDAEIVADYGR